MRLAKKDVKIIPVRTKKAEYCSARPTFTVLDNFLIQVLGLHEMPTWIDALEEYMKQEYKR